MHLWTEYEGRTVAEHYTLGKLLRSEGRNGFFATADKDGHPAVIRLTEAHFDEAELLSRWRQVAEVHQDNLIEIEQVGQTTLEGVALTFALMEPDDANLGDVLKERPLTTAETLQVAKAVLAALQALHARGLVHEHVEPANVLAVGETVKLRSDCVRECVADSEFNTPEGCADLRRRDLHDFGTLLLRCLTLESEWSAAHNNLPDPFKRLIPRALDGTWTLEQLGTALDPTLFGSKTASRPAFLSQAAPAPEVLNASTTSPHNGSTPNSLPSVPTPAASPRPLVPPGVRQTQRVDDTIAARPQPAAYAPEPEMPLRSRFEPELDLPTRTPSKAVWAVGTAVVLLVLLLGWHLFRPATRSADPGPAPVVSSGAVTRAANLSSAQPVVAPTSRTAPEPAAAAAVAAEGRSAGAPGWYVIAYTYNHEGQAAAKAQRLRRNHNSLHPQVFTPSGRPPFFVSLGGPMTQEEAEAVFRHARRSGLPRDTFVRHY